ncbi:MAG: type II secretion system F family protein [Patescibacteria group bacterium]|jgi:type IV pilus assembly protein PilC
MANLNQMFISLQRVPETAKIFMLQNLSVMIKAGLPLADALNILSEQGKSAKLKMVLGEIQQQIRGGKSFAEALLPYQRDFGEMFVNMIAAGEASGNLEGVLNNLYIQLKKDHTIKSKIKNAMIYPIIIVCAMIALSIFVMIYVLPNITSMFKDLEAGLPLPTKILIAVSNFVTTNGLILGPLIVLLFILLWRLTRSGPLRLLWHQLILKTPIIGPISIKINVARMSAALSSLIQTDIPIPDSLKITAKIMSNAVYRQALMEASEKIKKGIKLADVFKQYQVFPVIIIQMVAVGEETGSLDAVLKNLAEFYQEEVEQTMESLPTIIEPLLMILMGFGVGGLAIAIILPIYSMTSQF